MLRLLFSVEDLKEKIDFYPKDLVFDAAPKWKPIVTREEVLDYSKKELDKELDEEA